MSLRRYSLACITWVALSLSAPAMAEVRSLSTPTIQHVETMTIAQNKNRKRSGKRVTKKKRRTAVRKKPTKVGFVEFIAPILVFSSLLMVAFLHRRRRRDHAAPAIRARGKSRNIHFAGPRTLKAEAHADPATMTDDELMTGAIVPLNKADTSGGDDLTQAHMVQGKQLEVKDLTSAGLRIKAPKVNTPVDAPKPTGIRLPGDLGDRFTPVAGERLLTDAEFSAWGETQGTLGITNRRLLVVHRQTFAQWTPPFVATEDRQHKVSLSQISNIEIGKGYRVSTLWPGLALCWFFPIGTVLSLISIGAYFAFPRSVLEVTTGETIRRYPLHGEELDRIYNTLSRASAERRAKKRKKAAS